MKVYTRTGDRGTTSLFGGARVVKDDPRLEAYGTLDELNSVVGMVIADIEREKWPGSAALETNRLMDELRHIQEHIFVLGSHLATEDDKSRAKLPAIEDSKVKAFEEAMDRMSTDLPPLKHFILPGGIRCAASAHLARTVARRAERAIVSMEHAVFVTPKGAALTDLPEANRKGPASGLPPDTAWLISVVQHVNRLNDYFFVLARHLNRLASKEEPIWAP